MMNVRDEIDRLRGLSVPQLQDEYERVCGEPARSNNRVFLVKRIAWRIQAAAEGGLSEHALQKAAGLVREHDLRMRPTQEVHAAFNARAAVNTPARSGLPPVGSLITRMYRGRRLEVKVLDQTFEFDGQEYSSLTAVAKAATGADWNGRLFFGLTKRGNDA